MALTPGTRLGPYEITAQIGVGGMGEVYQSLRANPFKNDAGRGWKLTGRASLGGLISGVVGVANTVASPRGHALLWTPRIQGKARVAA